MRGASVSDVERFQGCDGTLCRVPLTASQSLGTLSPLGRGLPVRKSGDQHLFSKFTAVRRFLRAAKF